MNESIILMSNPKDILKQQLKDGIDYLATLIDLIGVHDLYNYSLSSDSRSSGEIVAHLIRSLHYYIKGVVSDNWDPLDYSTESYQSADELLGLLTKIKPEITKQIMEIGSNELHHNFENLDNPAFGLNLIIELLYHQSQHFGQLQGILRSKGVNPPAYSFII